MSILWSPSYQQSVFKRCHSDRHLSELYLQDCGKNYNYGTKLLHWHPMYSDVESLLHKFILFKFKWRDVADHAIQRCVRVCQNIQAFEAFHRGLRPVLTATGFVNERGQFLTTHRIHTPWPITKKFVVSDYIGDPLRLRKIWCKSAHGRGFWANGWNITTFLFYTVLHELTYRSDMWTDFHAWWLKRRGLAQGCDVHFGGFVDIASHFGGEIPPQNPNFGGVNWCFQAKRTNIESFMLSKLLHRF